MYVIVEMDSTKYASLLSICGINIFLFLYAKLHLIQLIANMTRKNLISNSDSKPTSSQAAITSLGSGTNEDLRLVWMAQYICTCFPDIPDGRYM